MAYLKRIDLWPRYIECVRVRASTRRAAGLIGCHRDTAFRWRHRLFANWVEADPTTLTGRVAMGQIWLPYSRKGQRGLGAEARHRGGARELALMIIPRVHVLLAREVNAEREPPDQQVFATNIGLSRARLKDYARVLLPRLRVPVELVAATGKYGAEARLARIAGGTYHRVERTAGIWPPDIWVLRNALKLWLRPFRGVATKYLEHYLRWFALGERLLGPGAVGCRV